MKILVFDDNELHRKAAAVLLKDHDVTIVSTYDEAQAALAPKVDYDKIRTSLIEMGWSDFQPWSEGVTEERRAEYYQAKEVAKERATYRIAFEVFLGDLLVPASSQSMGPDGEEFIGQEMPLGTSLAFLALSQGIKLVAVVTDTNHHNHPASATFDVFRKVFSVGDAKVLLTNESVVDYLDKDTLEEVLYEFLESDEGKKQYPYDKDSGKYTGVVRAKVWHRVLAKLLDS